MRETFKKISWLMAALFLPLMLMTAPTWAILALSPKIPWQAWDVVGALRWAIWTGFVTALLVPEHQDSLATQSKRARLFAWVGATAAYIALQSVLTVANQVLLRYVYSVAALIGLLGVMVEFLMLLAPAVAVARGASPIRTLRMSLRLMALNWRYLGILLVAFYLPYFATMLLGSIAWSYRTVPWGAAQLLISSVAYCILAIPGVLLASILAIGDTNRVQRRGEMQLPAIVRLAGGVVSSALLACAVYFLLKSTLPVSWQVAAEPASRKMLIIGMFIPVSPVQLLIMLLPGVLCGWLAASVSSARWTAGIAGFLFGLAAIHIQVGLTPFEKPVCLPWYLLALCMYSLIGILGFQFRTWVTSRDGARGT